MFAQTGRTRSQVEWAAPEITDTGLKKHRAICSPLSYWRRWTCLGKPTYLAM